MHRGACRHAQVCNELGVPPVLVLLDVSHAAVTVVVAVAVLHDVLALAPTSTGPTHSQSPSKDRQLSRESRLHVCIVRFAAD